MVKNSLLSDLNVQEKGGECQQTQITRYEESSSARSDDNLHRRLSTQSDINLKSVPANFFIRLRRRPRPMAVVECEEDNPPKPCA
jgi:hypothetical protein